MKLSICMMVKNEEKNLDRCLTSLSPLMSAVESELIVVDTGSEDTTVEIAKKYTDKVYFHPWNNNFAQMRNISFSYAKGEWILMIDADEEIEDATEIINFLSLKTHNSYTAASVLIKSIINNTEAGTNFSTATRLFKNNGKIEFNGSIHEHVFMSGNIFFINTIFIHYGYLDSDAALMEKKFQRNISLLLSEVEKNPDNIYYRIYISVQYFIHKEFQEALKHALTAYKIMKQKNLNPKDYLFLYPKLAFCYYETNRFEEAKEICIEGLKLNDEHLDLYFVLANLEIKSKDYDEAIKHYKKYLQLIQNFDKLSIKEDSTGNFSTMNRYDEVYTDIAFAYTEMGKYDLALEYIQKANEDTFIERILGIYVKIFILSKQFDKLKEFYDTKVLQKSENEINTFALMVDASHEKLTDDEWLSLLTEFSVGESPYSRFCAIKIAYLKKLPEFNKLAINFLSDFSISTPLYLDIIYYSITLKENIGYILSDLRDVTIREYLAALHKRYNDFSSKVLDYLKLYGISPFFGELKFNRCLQLYLLNIDILSDDEYKLILTDYIRNGLEYIYKIYSEIIYENEMVNEVKDSYEAFLIYMHHAQQMKNSNGAKYVNYLRKALNICPEMNRGVQLLLNEFEKQQNTTNEFEQYKLQLKNIIKNLISSSQFNQALDIINEYKKIIKNDSEIEYLENDIILKCV